MWHQQQWCSHCNGICRTVGVAPVQAGGSRGQGRQGCSGGCNTGRAAAGPVQALQGVQVVRGCRFECPPACSAVWRESCQQHKLRCKCCWWQGERQDGRRSAQVCSLSLVTLRRHMLSCCQVVTGNWEASQRAMPTFGHTHRLPAQAQPPGDQAAAAACQRRAQRPACRCNVTRSPSDPIVPDHLAVAACWLCHRSFKRHTEAKFVPLLQWMLLQPPGRWLLHWRARRSLSRCGLRTTSASSALQPRQQQPKRGR